MPTSRAERRRARLEEADGLPWLSQGSRSVVRSPETGDASSRNPVIDSQYLGDLSEELGDVISLSGGTIGDLKPPEFVRDAARRAVDDYGRYPGIKGHRDVRVAMSEKLRRENNIEADPDQEILPTIGCQQVIDSTLRLLVSPGDEVLIFDPEYASTEPAIRMAGGTAVYVGLAYDGETWSLDIDALRRAITPKTKLLVMSNPHNPTGIVFSRSELEEIAELAIRHDFWVFSDEEYEKTLFDGAEHCSIASLDGMKDRTVTGFSFSKPFAMTAYRIGYMVGPAPLMDHMYQIMRFSLQAVSAVGLRAAHAVLTSDMRPWLKENIENLTRKRDYTVKRLNAMHGVRCHTPRGVYFAFPDVRELGLSSFDLTEFLIREARVSVGAGSGFGPSGEGHVRVSFCPSMDDIETGLDRIEAALRTL